ncbi:hypothetical protein HANVADRAFT_51037 [Hanseniaspora valbyensis NRRL Y-1626]|uniref:Phosphatidylinositol 4-kinase n=1 Tax=Hanseniaspora valbyensis NRRL Y-1626 TaxID=766949 RepID=A0A1B7TK42_9ASCO|nr:hypothetical protein HANVADRAFT_51037 [Hanseniaspora valbyensis NRRL Y-1626]
MPLLNKDRIVNNINVKNNFILVENSNLKLRKKVSVFSLHDTKSVHSSHHFNKFTQSTLPEPGIFLNTNNDSNIFLEEDEEDNILLDLIEKYKFFQKYFKKELKYTLFKPIHLKQTYDHKKIIEDKELMNIIHEFDINFKKCIHTIKYGNIQPKLIAGGSSGTYIIFGSNDLPTQNAEPTFIFKPMNEEPYSKKFQPKWLKYLQYKLLPFTFGRECLLEDGNYGYITDLMVSRLDYLLFKKEMIVPWCDVCVLESGSFFNNFKTKKNVGNSQKERTLFQNLSDEILNEHEGGSNFLVFYFFFLKKLFHKLWQILLLYLTGGYKLITIQRKLGSLQVFEKGFVTANDFLEKNPLPPTDLLDGESFGIWNQTLLNNLHQKLQRLYILDFLTRNTDRNLDNWMLRLNASNQLELKAIDNSLAFPYKHPSSMRTYTFEWLSQLPRYILEKPLEKELISDIMNKLIDQNWWNDWRLTFWECHSRSGKVFTSSNGYDSDENGNYFDNPPLLSIEDKTFELNIDSKVNLQWSLFKGQAFLLYKLIKAGLSEIDVNVLDLIQMERCYVYEDPCYYYHHNEEPLNNESTENGDSLEKLKKKIWEGLGLDINEMLSDKSSGYSNLQDDTQSTKSLLDKKWKLYLSGQMTDEEWLDYLRQYKNYDNGVMDSDLNKENYNPFQENCLLDLEDPNENGLVFNTTDIGPLLSDDVFVSPSKFTIASSINNDTSLISEYFYDAMSSINKNSRINFQEQEQEVNHYESIPISISTIDERDKNLILKSSNSILSKTPLSLTINYTNDSRYIDNSQLFISEDNNINEFFDNQKQNNNNVTKFDVEIVYIDRLEICQEQKPFFKNW